MKTDTIEEIEKLLEKTAPGKLIWEEEVTLMTSLRSIIEQLLKELKIWKDIALTEAYWEGKTTAETKAELEEKARRFMEGRQKGKL